MAEQPETLRRLPDLLENWKGAGWDNRTGITEEEADRLMNHAEGQVLHGGKVGHPGGFPKPHLPIALISACHFKLLRPLRAKAIDLLKHFCPAASGTAHCTMTMPARVPLGMFSGLSPLPMG